MKSFLPSKTFPLRLDTFDSFLQLKAVRDNKSVEFPHQRVLQPKSKSNRVLFLFAVYFYFVICNNSNYPLLEQKISHTRPTHLKYRCSRLHHHGLIVDEYFNFFGRSWGKGADSGIVYSWDTRHLPQHSGHRHPHHLHHAQVTRSNTENLFIPSFGNVGLGNFRKISTFNLFDSAENSISPTFSFAPKSHHNIDATFPI